MNKNCLAPNYVVKEMALLCRWYDPICAASIIFWWQEPLPLRKSHTRSSTRCPAFQSANGRRVVNSNLKAKIKIEMGTQVLELAGLRIVQLGALDDDGVRRQVDPPRQCRRRAQHLRVFDGDVRSHWMGTPVAATH